METRILTGTGLTISRVSLGGMTFGGQVNERDSMEIIQSAYDSGVNFFDTANTYNAGIGETILGKAVKPFREKIILTTKVGYGTVPNSDWQNPNISPNEMGLSRKNIMRAVDESLTRLDTDYIDVFYFHRPIYDTPIEESLETMTTLVRSGKVRYFGVCNHAAWQICENIWYNRSHGGIMPAVAQNIYNMITRSLEVELAPFLHEYKTGLVIYNPIAGGLLSGKHTFDKAAANTRFDNNKYYADRYWYKENFEAIAMLEKVAQKHGMSLLELALRWCVSQDHVDSVILGVSRLEQLRQNMAFMDKGKLSREILDECDEVWLFLRGHHAKYNRGKYDM